MCTNEKHCAVAGDNIISKRGENEREGRFGKEDNLGSKFFSCFSTLDVANTQCNCGHRLSSFCSCRLSISLLHGVQVIEDESCD
ncbi:hypothetical protein Vadar_016294 [Vaccinium darrowii]|uniref:Uncharacterized protein n=1 Tax=Vaccinium darrowii TaxID=229202 RepID=A0ACB7XAT6_9ERIC|nr:hypothetical protein Vadar_016294 [Vaccinium darrowii]